MAGRIQGITIEIGGNTTKLDNALKGVNKSLNKTQTALKDVDKLLKLKPGNVELLQQKQELLNKAVADTKKKLEAEKEALAQLEKADKTPEVVEQMERLKRQIIDDENALESLKQKSKDFGSVTVQQVKAAADKIKEFGGKVSDVGKKIQGVGDSLTKHVTGPLVAVGAAGLAAFNEVDGAMDTLIKKTGASGKSFEGMRKNVENIATRIPTDFQTAAEAVGEVNTRFGLTGDALEDLSEKFIKFADLNDTDVSSAIDSVQAALAMFGLSADDAADVLDILNKAAQDTGAPVDELAQSLLTNGTALQEMGFGINEAVGFLSQLDKSGVDSASTMTGLKKALQNATKEGKPLNDALKEMQDNMKGAKTDTEAAQIASELFGNKAGPAIAQAVRDGRLSFDELSASVQNFGGSVEDTYANTQDDIDNWQLAVNEGKLLLSDLGETIGGVIAPAFEQLRDKLQEVRDKWDGLDEGTQNALIQFAIVAGVVGPIVGIVGGIVTGIGNLITAVGIIGGALAPVIAGFSGVAGVLMGPVGLAIATAIGAFVLFLNYHEKIEQKTGELVGVVSEKWNTLKANLSAAVDNIKNAISEKWNAIKTNVSNTAESIRSTVSAKFNAVKTAITTPIETAKKSVTDAINKIKSVVNNAKLSLPHFKLPHFNVSGGVPPYGLGGMGVKPSFSVSWYRKAYDNPVVFNTPTVLPTANGYKGFGDGTGAEIVMSLNKLREMVGSGSVTNNIVVNAAPGMDVRELAEAVADRIEFQTQQQRAVFA